MKISYYLLMLLTLFVVVSCEDNNSTPEPDPVTFLTIELKETFMNNAADKWVFATNENGEVLDIIQLQSGMSTVDLQTITSFSTIDFTIFTLYDQSTTDFFTLDTFKEYPKNETIVLGTTPTPSEPPAGFANITITNYTEVMDASLNIKFSTKTYGTTGGSNLAASGSNYSADVALPATSETVHVYGLRSGIPVYSMLDEVVPGESRTVDFSAFEPFENVVQLPVFGYAYTVGIADDKSQFELVSSAKLDSDYPGQVYTATVPGFSKYLTFIDSYSGFEYWRIGTPITSFTCQHTALL